MKKITGTILTLSLALMSSTLIAQTNNFSIGPRAGINIANVSNLDNTKASVGPVVGITSTYSFAQTSGVTLDVLYSQEGYDLDNGIKVNINYLQVPFYYDLFFGSLGEAFRPKVYIGVAPGFLLSAKSGDTDVSESLTNVVVSLSGGLGFYYRIADRVWLNTDLRSYLGLTDVREEAFRNGDKVAGRNIQLSAGVAFGLTQ
jgi:outer membrane protein W